MFDIKWKEHYTVHTPLILPGLIAIGDFIYYSSAHRSLDEQSQSGITRIDIKSQKVVETIQYPSHVRPCRHYCCQHNDKIYIIDGEHGQIILLDPSSKKYTKKLDIPRIGRYPCAVVMHDQIHIFNGGSNHQHLIYDIASNSMT